MKLFVDMDAVLCDFIEGFISMVFWKYGKVITEQDIITYDLANNTGLTREQVNSIFGSPCFFISLRPMPEAIEHMKLLSEDNRFDLWIATNPASIISAEEKYMWVKKFLPFIPLNKIIMISDKTMLKGDVIIDDNPEFLEGFEGKTICFDYLYNRNTEVDYRVNNWKECYQVLKGLVS